MFGSSLYNKKSNLFSVDIRNRVTLVLTYLGDRFLCNKTNCLSVSEKRTKELSKMVIVNFNI